MLRIHNSTDIFVTRDISDVSEKASKTEIKLLVKWNGSTNKNDCQGWSDHHGIRVIRQDRPDEADKTGRE